MIETEKNGHLVVVERAINSKFEKKKNEFLEACFKKCSIGDEDYNCHGKTKKHKKMFAIKTLRHICFFYLVQSFIHISGPQFSPQN